MRGDIVKNWFSFIKMKSVKTTWHESRRGRRHSLRRDSPLSLSARRRWTFRISRVTTFLFLFTLLQFLLFLFLLLLGFTLLLPLLLLFLLLLFILLWPLLFFFPGWWLFDLWTSCLPITIRIIGEIDKIGWKRRSKVVFVLAFERIVYFLRDLFAWLVPDVPEDVR